MRIGLGPIELGGVSRVQLQSLAEAAVAASFDSVWVAEDRANGVGGGLAAAAMVAEWIPIRTGAAVDLAGHHPLYLAEDIAVADLTTRGRIEVLVRGGTEEQMRLLVEALSGAHLRFEGETLRVPAGLEANQPAPRRLALNPRPAQPVVPLWIEEARIAEEIGAGVAARWHPGTTAPSASGRWPGMLLCPSDVDGDALVEAAGGESAYFLIAATTAGEAIEAGRRLVGPLRMPEFPEWIRRQ